MGLLGIGYRWEAAMIDRVCPGCGTDARDNNYCPKCGLSLAQQAELPSRQQWEANRAEQAEPAPREKEAQLPGSAPSGATAEDAGEGDPVTVAAAVARVRRWWNAVGTRTKRSAIGGAALLALAVVVVVVVASGGGSKSSVAGSGAANGPSADSAVSEPSAAQVCAAAWNSEASQLDLQMAAGFSAGEGGEAAAGYESADPSLCLVTFAHGSGEYATVMQFDQEPGGGGFEQGADGTAAMLPGDWAWNATAGSGGTMSAS
jgi:hypothetical protein